MGNMDPDKKKKTEQEIYFESLTTNILLMIILPLYLIFVLFGLDQINL